LGLPGVPNSQVVPPVGPLPHLSFAEFRHCAFSGDNKFLATIGGTAADTLLVVWKWNSESVVAVAKCSPSVSRVRFVPRDSSLLTVSGPSYLRIWRCQGDALKELPMLPPKHEAEVR
jgi:WD40 repeat protein